MRTNGAHIDVEGRMALAFNTGLSSAAFAQAKLAQLVSEPGIIVAGDGETRHWRAEGVVEREEGMTIWGPDFEGERLDRIILGSDAAAALNALRRWIAARLRLEELAPEEKNRICLYPAAAFVAIDGEVLFSPERLTLRALDAEGEASRLDGAERWIHPDLSGEQGESFAAGAMAYRVICGESPFPAQDADSVRADMRDGCAIPAKLTKAGLDESMASLLDAAIAPAPEKTTPARKIRKDQSARPTLAAIADAIGPVSRKGPEVFFREATKKEEDALELERAKLTRKRHATVGTKRFVRRNTTIITVVAVSVLAAVFIVRGIIKDKANQPTTAGMSPRQVVETYYTSFGTLDHTLMEACVVDKAGAGDIEAAMNLFVISRVREAYERMKSSYTAEEWLAAGSPPVAGTVYGVADLKLEETDADESDGMVSFKADYDLWRPSEGRDSIEGDEKTATEAPRASDSAESSAGAQGEAVQATTAPPPVSVKREDVLTLVFRDERWRISKIDRTEKAETEQ